MDLTKNYPAAAVNDAMGQTNTMDAGIKPIYPGMKVIGEAFTVQCNPGSLITIHKALGELPEDSILVVDGRGDPSAALMGEVMSTEAQKKGAKGIVIDGAIRDIEGIKNNLELPVFTRHVSPRVGTNDVVGETGGTIVCGGAIVNSGDLIVGDDDGVVVIPKNQAEDILEKTLAVEEEDLSVIEKVKNENAHVADITGKSKLIEEAEKKK